MPNRLEDTSRDLIALRTKHGADRLGYCSLSVGDCHETRSDIYFWNWTADLGRFGDGRLLDRSPNCSNRWLQGKVLT